MTHKHASFRRMTVSGAASGDGMSDAKRRRGLAPLSYLPGVNTAVGVLFYLRDRAAPLRGRLLLATSLVYLLSPIDIIPEMFLGPLGLADDAAVALGVLKFLFSKSMKPYRAQARHWFRGE